MEAEVQFLRKKVNQLEELIFNMNKKVGFLLDKFLSYRAEQVAGHQRLLKQEEEICLQLLTQYKSGEEPEVVESRGTASARGRSDKTKSKVETKDRPYLARSNSSNRGQTHSYQTRGKRPNYEQVESEEENSDDLGGDDDYANEDVSDDEDDCEPTERTRSKHAFKNRKTKSGNLEEVSVEVKSEPADYLHEEMDIGTASPMSAGVSDSETSNTNDGKYWKNHQASSSGTSARPRKTSKKGSTQSRRLSYIMERVFDTEDEAVAFIRSEEQWTKNSVSVTQEGRKVMYRCKNVVCKVYSYLLTLRRTGKIEFYRSQIEHDHTYRSDMKITGVSKEVQDLIDDLFDNGITKCSLVLKELRRQNLEVIPQCRLERYLRQLRVRKFGDLSFMKDEPKSKKARKVARPSSSSGGVNNSENSQSSGVTGTSFEGSSSLAVAAAVPTLIPTTNNSMNMGNLLS